MKGDFSRNSFDPNKHYRGVRMQQGRVQMDADWNEQIDITDYRDRLFTEDFLGDAIGPADGSGFSVGVTSDQKNLTIGLGRYYVNGLLLENNNSLYFTQQNDYPQATLPTQDGVYLAYLDVWQRSLSITDDADMAENALGGADTATRLYTAGQVKLMLTNSTGISDLTYHGLFNPTAPLDSPAYTNAQYWNALTGRLPSTIVSPQLFPEVGTLNSGNQTYQIQIHQGGSLNTATYKVSTDNPLVEIPITTINGNVITLPQVPTGQTPFAVNQWLELTTSPRIKAQLPGDMVKISSISGSGQTGVTLTLSGTISSDITVSNGATAIRWQQDVLSVAKSSQQPLETGLIIHFLGDAFDNGHQWNLVKNGQTIHWTTEHQKFVPLPPNSASISQLKPSVSNPTLQNQLYRVEIHQGSQNANGNSTTPSFKWSRDNGSVSSSLASINGNTLTLTTQPPDGINAFALNQWLELLTPTRELKGVPGDMVQIIKINGSTLTVSGTIGSDITVANQALARRWDTAINGSAPAVNNVTINNALPIENGLSITFSGTDFKTGDYWLIPARAAINGQSSHIEWLMNDSGSYLAQLPNGIQHSYAPLAIVKRTNGNWIFESDSRTLTIPLSQLNIKVIGADACAPADTIHVDCNGQVGISTDTPQAKLDVQTSATMTSQDALHAIANGNGVAILASTHNNTTASLSNNSAQTTLNVVNNGTGSAAIFNNIGDSQKNSTLIVNSSGSGDGIRVITNDSTGVGIWNTSSKPSLYLHNGVSTGLYAVADAGHAGLFLNNDENADFQTLPTLYATSTSFVAALFTNNSATQTTVQINNNGTGLALQTTGSVSINGNLTITKINGGSFSVTPAANKVPVADSSGHLDSGWLPSGSGFTTGDTKLTYKTVADPGWVMMNDGTIGNASSGATTRANADTQNLFVLLWNNCADAQCPVSGGRGTSALNDFNANKRINLPLVRGRAFGSAGAGAGLTSRALAQTVGEEKHTLTVSEIPAHNHSYQHVNPDNFGPVYWISSGNGNKCLGNYTSGNSGGGNSHNIMQPTTFINLMIKL